MYTGARRVGRICFGGLTNETRCVHISVFLREHDNCCLEVVGDDRGEQHHQCWISE